MESTARKLSVTAGPEPETFKKNDSRQGRCTDMYHLNVGCCSKIISHATYDKDDWRHNSYQM